MGFYLFLSSWLSVFETHEMLLACPYSVILYQSMTLTTQFKNEGRVMNG